MWERSGCHGSLAPISSGLSVSEDQDEVPVPPAEKAADEAPAEAAPAEPDGGLKVGKRLKEPFRHPTRNYIILPKHQALNDSMIEAIKLMAAERQAIMCLGEPLPEALQNADDVLRDGPIAIQRIEMNTRVVRNGRDALAMFAVLMAIFAIALRNPILIALMVLSVVGWVALGLIAVATMRKIQEILEQIDEERGRRAKGELLLAEAAKQAGVPDRSK
jgi:hypothetical protein